MRAAESRTGPAARELTVVVVAAAVAGALALIAGGQEWAGITAERRAPLPPVGGVVTGADAAPLVPAAGLVLLAAAVALLAVRGAGRAAVGLIVAAAGGVLVWSGGRALTAGMDGVSAEELGVGGVPGPVTVDVTAGWPVVAVVAGVLALAAGLVAVRRGRAWPAMGRRYERPAEPAGGTSRPAAARDDEDRAQDAWKALDRGEDPTA